MPASASRAKFGFGYAFSVTGILGAGLDLIFPQYCAGCGAWGAQLCRTCLDALRGEWEEVSAGAVYLQVFDPAGEEYMPAFPVFSLNPHTGTAQKTVAAWKHASLAALDRSLLDLWQMRLVSLRDMPGMETAGACVAVNAPSGFRRRHRGQLIAAKLASAAAEVFGCGYCDALRTKFSPGDLRPARPHYSVAGKNERLAKGERIKCVKNLAGREVLLFDDVLTTGATMLGCARVLAENGACVRAGITFSHRGTTGHFGAGGHI